MAQTQEYFDRYMAGEHVLVWQELIALGDQVRQEPLLSESLRVCTELVRRVRLNLRTLHCRLQELGYQFADPEASLLDATECAIDKVREVERQLGVFPLLARVWYQTFDSVDFRQAESQLRVYDYGIRPPAGPDIFGLGSHPVLIFQGLDRCNEQLRQMDAEEEKHLQAVKEWGPEYQPLDEGPSGPFLPLGGWASNCEEKGFRLPCLGIDGVLYNDGGGDTYMADELRRAFQWGGFPFWQWAFKKADFYAPYQYRPNIEKLLPILKEGLVEL
jgi:hypothetical protein